MTGRSEGPCVAPSALTATRWRLRATDSEALEKVVADRPDLLVLDVEADAATGRAGSAMRLRRATTCRFWC